MILDEEIRTTVFSLDFSLRMFQGLPGSEGGEVVNLKGGRKT